MNGLRHRGRRAHRDFLTFLLFVLLLLVSCGSDEAATAVPRTPTPDLPFTLADGFTAEAAVTGLSRPTQMIWGPDGRVWIAQLYKEESDNVGQVVAVDLEAGGAKEILLEELNKPTGIAVLDNALWIAEESQLLRADLDENLKPQAPEVILSDMPNNGRSNGTLTVSPEGFLIYETSGRRSGNEASEGSGILWALDPANPENPTILATGLKNAYAHVFDANGRLWVTEIGDGAVTGEGFEGQPPEELNLIIEGANYGWPQCYGNQEPALNREGTAEICARTELPVALFPPQATPTSIVVAPWDDSVLLVTQWLRGEITAVSLSEQDGRFVGTSSPFLTNILNPQHLLPTPDGALLFSEHRSGAIWRISPTGQ